MKKIVISAVAAGVMFLIAQFVFSIQHAILIALIAFLVVLWTNEGLPLGVVSLLPILLFPAFGMLDVKSTTSNYSNPTIFLFLGDL